MPDWRRLFGRSRAAPRLTPELGRRIRSSFDEASRDEEHFPSTIDPRIWHVRLLLEHLGDLAGRRVLDVGCGKGRFARIVKERHPGAEVWGLDLSGEMLRFLPADVRPCCGSMTALPFAEASFQAAYATESLEHAVDIPLAIAEICRVVAPGGRIVVIDKNAAQCGRLATPEWEQWFTPRQLEKLLSRHCREVSSRLISYWEDVEPDGLFIAWTALR